MRRKIVSCDPKARSKNKARRCWRPGPRCRYPGAAMAASRLSQGPGETRGCIALVTERKLCALCPCNGGEQGPCSLHYYRYSY